MSFVPDELRSEKGYNSQEQHFDFLLDCDITHSPRHWSTEEIMIRYVSNITMPLVEETRESLGNTRLFKAQVKVAQNYSYVASTTAINNAAANHKLIMH